MNFPSYATLSSAEVTFADMGEKTISTQLKIDGSIAPDFTYDWEVEYKGEKYIMPLRKPQGSKENTSLDAVVDLTFQHWAIYQLKRWLFVSTEWTPNAVAFPDKYVASVSLNLGDFCELFKRVLQHYYGDTITIDLYPKWEYKSEPTNVSIDNSYIWDVLLKLHELFAVRWSIEDAEGNDNTTEGGERYVIKVGYPTEDVGHIFEYGFEGGLLKVERQVQDENIRNMLIGRGGTKNLPRYYFKEVPQADKARFRQDPDWVPELANVYFDRLRGATFRSYIQGWKHKHHGGANKRATAYAQWAYDKGYNDEKFDPVEYVKDDESIKNYGELFGGLADNEDYYPTIQLSGQNIAVEVEQIKSDEIKQDSDRKAVFFNVREANVTAKGVAPTKSATVTLNGPWFYVGTGKAGNLYDNTVLKTIINSDTLETVAADYYGKTICEGHAELEVLSVRVFDDQGKEHSSVGLSGGHYRYEIEVRVTNLSDEATYDIEVGTYRPMVLQSEAPTDEWSNTFDVWIPNVWGSEYANEGEAEYAERIWSPILGDGNGTEAKVLFTTGALAASEDYEFKIVKIPEYDTSKTYYDSSGKEYTSEWRLTLQKSDADFEALNLYVPSTKRQGAAGDRFVFLGIEPTQEYVEWAERALDDNKKDELNKVKDIKPTWAVETDRVRLNNNGNEGALIERLNIGHSLRLADSRFITTLNENGEIVPSSAETLYIKEIKYTYREPSSEDNALNPDVSLTLSDDYTTSGSAVSTLQGEVNALRQQLGSLSNLEQLIRAIGDKLYLRKDGLSDRSYSPTEFNSLLTSTGFRSGIIGGQGWGFFKDADSSWVLETDKLNIREEMQVNTLVVNQAEARGGMEISTAAAIEVTQVIMRDNNYYCYFDQKSGSVQNLFKVDDVAYSQRWKPDNAELKYYKRRVLEVGVDYIVLKGKGVQDMGTVINGIIDYGYTGSGIPEQGDIIIHYGNYTDKTRQYVKVRDVINGGYERFLDGLNAVTAKGNEYYFVGMLNGSYGDKPRFFIGNDDNFIEFLQGKLTIKADLSIESTFGGKTLDDIVDPKISAAIGGFDYLTAALQGNTTVSGGLVLTQFIGVGEEKDGVYVLRAGMNGVGNAEHPNGGVVFWGGGTLAEAENGTSTYVIYADGTGHAANGTIVFAENALKVGQYVNLTDEGLNMTIGGERKMQMGNYEIEGAYVLNHHMDIPLKKWDEYHNEWRPLVYIQQPSGLNYWRAPSGNTYSIYVEGLGSKSTPVTFEIDLGTIVKGATIELKPLDIALGNLGIPTQFTQVNQSGVPSVSAAVYTDGGAVEHSFGEAAAYITTKDGSGDLGYSFTGKSFVAQKDYANLKLRVTIYNKLSYTDNMNDTWVNGIVGGIVSGDSDYVVQTIPEYNETVFGANGLQTSWGNAHQYQRNNLWAVRVGEHGLQVTNGDVRIYAPETNYEWWEIDRYIKAIIAEYNKEKGLE